MTNQMIEQKKFYRKFLPWFFVLAALLECAAFPQEQAPKTPPATNGQDQNAKSGPERKISPEEAEQLFRSVDEILEFASKDTDLPVKHKVKRQLASRDQVVAYLEKTMAEDKDAQRLRRSELVLKKFGLLPPDFNLQSFLVTLLREQVAGYYDPKTKTVNLLDWLDVEQQRPVLAHELTHALQDQSFDLDKWMKAGDVDLADVARPTPTDIANDEITEARQAVVEGQAMVVLVDYMLAPTGQSLLESPQVAEALKAGMLVGTGDSPEFSSAPIFLKEELTFAYRYGLDFIAALLRKGGREKAFADVFTHPPQSSRQIMEPQTYFSGEHLPLMRIPDFQQDFKDYDRVDVGAIGEFDVAVLVDQYAGVEASQDIYPHWRGGYYYAGRPKGDSSGPLALVYFSRWSDSDVAAHFAAIYANALTKRYKHVRESSQSANPAVQPQNAETLTGTHSWLTEAGSVVIAIEADSVLITESLDQTTTDKLQNELLSVPATTGK
jgi:hypothetical protein